MFEQRLETTAAIRSRMSRQRRRDTEPEVALRRLLHSRGYRFLVDAPLPGLPRRRADLLFTRRKLAVFVDGCFWHGCPLHATRPANNGDWWAVKLDRNIERDRETDRHLTEIGWKVLRIWEHTSAVEAAQLVQGTIDLIDHGPPMQ